MSTTMTMTTFDKDNKFNTSRSSDDHTVDTEGSHTVDADSDMIQEVMQDNLDMMLEIIMKIREDPEFARNIYTECPRLQHLLDQHPDLRPIFEDPHLVRINFEQVYRKAGGVLPEDKPGFVKRTLIKVVSHPLFRVVKVLLIFKKIFMCIKRIYMMTVGGGFTKLKNFVVNLFTGRSMNANVDDAGRAIADNANPTAAAKLANQRSLAVAADHMDEPEVKEQMRRLLLSDPDSLDEAIELDPDLRNLRASDPLCAELMSDPSTMKIVVDSDNLRALGDCPDLIEADFNDPDWRPPDVEGGNFDDADNFFRNDEVVDSSNDDLNNNTSSGTGTGTGTVVGAGADVDGDGFVEADVDGDGVYETDTDGDGNVEANGEDPNLAQQEEGGGAVSEFLDEYERGDTQAAAARGQARSQQNEEEEEEEGGEQKQQPQRGGGFLGSIGTGLVNYVAMQAVGVTVSELMSGGDDFGLGALGEQAEQIAAAAQQAEEKLGVMSSFEEVQDIALNDDVTKNLEDTVNEVEAVAQEAEEEAEEEVENLALSAGGGIGLAGGAAFGGALLLDGGGGGGTGAQARSANVNEEEETEDGEQPKSRGRGVFRGAAGMIGTMMKEMVATSVLGDDFGEALVETMNEKKEKDNPDEDDDKKNEGEKGENDIQTGDQKSDKPDDNQGSKRWYD